MRWGTTDDLSFFFSILFSSVHLPPTIFSSLLLFSYPHVYLDSSTFSYYFLPLSFSTSPSFLSLSLPLPPSSLFLYLSLLPLSFSISPPSSLFLYLSLLPLSFSIPPPSSTLFLYLSSFFYSLSLSLLLLLLFSALIHSPTTFTATN